MRMISSVKYRSLERGMYRKTPHSTATLTVLVTGVERVAVRLKGRFKIPVVPVGIGPVPALAHQSPGHQPIAKDIPSSHELGIWCISAEIDS